jgi:hypothetical protein
MNVSLAPVPAEQDAATCANCGAALVAGQRYCLSCGQPCSPVRLAFLDAIQSEQQPGGLGAPVAYTPLLEPAGAPGWLRRYSGLFGVISVLLTAMIIGLLVGHWVTQGKSPAKQVLEVKGLGSVPAAAAAGTAPSSTSSTATSAAGKSKAKAEAEEAKAGARETAVEKAPPPKPVKVTGSKLKKLSSTTGKKHQEEINALGAQPIETGG